MFTNCLIQVIPDTLSSVEPIFCWLQVKMYKSYSAFLFLILIAFPIQNLSAGNSLKISAVFGRNMVIQRGINFPVWGTPDAGKAITVDFAGYKTSASVDENGNWMASLPVLNAGGPFTMKVYTGTDTVTLTNVLVGNVWLVSGQSNMQMALSWGINNKYEEIINELYHKPDFNLYSA